MHSGQQTFPFKFQHKASDRRISGIAKILFQLPCGKFTRPICRERKLPELFHLPGNDALCSLHSRIVRSTTGQPSASMSTVGIAGLQSAGVQAFSFVLEKAFAGKWPAGKCEENMNVHSSRHTNGSLPIAEYGA